MISVLLFSVDEEENLQRPEIYPGEVIIVGFILVAWFCAIALFLHKWGKLRILQNDQPRFNHSPKNIETIKVVKRATDSVIHRSHSTQYTKTMMAREKRLARINTMPNIKVNMKDINNLSTPKTEEQNGELKEEEVNNMKNDKVKAEKHKYKVFSRTITSPVLELEEPNSSSVQVSHYTRGTV